MRCFLQFLSYCGCTGLLLAACHAEPPATAQPQRAPRAAPAVVAAPAAPAPVAPVAPIAAPAAPPAQPFPSLAPFVPAGYGVLDSAVGDLNRDAWPDVVLALRQNGEDTIPDELPRPLLLLLGQPDHRLALAARNDHVVLYRTWGGAYGDPYSGLTVKHGFFSVEHYGGNVLRWTRIITFKYAPADRTWYLHREGGEETSPSGPQPVSSAVSTPYDFGKIPFAAYNNDQHY